MTLLAYGAEKVRALERALGGIPPQSAADRAIADLTRHVQVRHEQRQAHLKQVNPLLEQAQAPLLRQIRADERSCASLQQYRKYLKERKQQPHVKPPARARVESRIVAGSGFDVKGYPFDVPFQAAHGDYTTAEATVYNGEFQLQCAANGGSAASSAGLAAWFFLVEDDPQQRFATLVDYTYNWSDDSYGYTAHNDGAMNLWVWGNSENAWVAQQGGFSPSWSDGTGWFESHDSGGLTSGTSAMETFFPARANSWYLCFAWFGASCDDTDPGDVFGSDAGLYIAGFIPFMVMGSLF